MVVKMMISAREKLESWSRLPRVNYKLKLVLHNNSKVVLASRVGNGRVVWYRRWRLWFKRRVSGVMGCLPSACDTSALGCGKIPLESMPNVNSLQHLGPCWCPFKAWFRLWKRRRAIPCCVLRRMHSTHRVPDGIGPSTIPLPSKIDAPGPSDDFSPKISMGKADSMKDQGWNLKQVDQRPLFQTLITSRIWGSPPTFVNLKRARCPHLAV
ncbi:hypothetical protein FA13DRAFT_1717407 [Coprinellus micaceus]|uniref:Uncharacterized protein n=1 Tax=Coprinellus micaceus TaxID=71717 RepID=A0A4Y7SGY1_COPMI|nr:hypothetical protein FA13DRAFT_1717407 [Coprinellus micaceus]